MNTEKSLRIAASMKKLLLTHKPHLTCPLSDERTFLVAKAAQLQNWFLKRIPKGI